MRASLSLLLLCVPMVVFAQAPKSEADRNDQRANLVSDGNVKIYRQPNILRLCLFMRTDISMRQVESGLSTARSNYLVELDRFLSEPRPPRC